MEDPGEGTHLAAVVFTGAASIASVASAEPPPRGPGELNAQTTEVQILALDDFKRAASTADYNGVGNHEFDEGAAELTRMQEGGCHPVDGCFGGDGFDGADVLPSIPGRIATEARLVLRQHLDGPAECCRLNASHSPRGAP